MLVLDIILLILLISCVSYCWSLHRKIKELQDSKFDFVEILRQFDSALVKADSSVENLSTLTDNASKSLNEAIGKAQMLSNDLMIMNEFGANVAEKLERTINKGRKEQMAFDKEKLSSEEDSSSYDSKSEDTLIHKNEIKPLAQKISTEEKEILDQNSYFNTLKKVMVKK